MSGSYDRPSRPGAPPRLRDFESADPFAAPDVATDPRTGPPTARRPTSPPEPDYAYPPAAAPVTPLQPAGREPDYGTIEIEPEAEPATGRPGRGADLLVEARGKRRKEQRQTPIVPAGSVTGRSLTLVISIMCFLACLTAGAVYMMNQNASIWLADIASEVTVQIEPRDKVDTDQTVREVIRTLLQQRGIKSADPLSQAEASRPLEAWLGSSEALQSLPVPRLISIKLDPAQAPNLAAISKSLEAAHAGVRLDDHRQWMRQIQTVTRSFALGGFAILLLVGAATTAIIVSATRSSMASNREIVEVLNFVGATDRFIAGEFQSHFLSLGIRAGVVGAAAAMVVFFLMPVGVELLGGGEPTTVEFRRLIGSGSLDVLGHLVLVGVIVVIAALCMITSRLGVFHILNSRQ